MATDPRAQFKLRPRELFFGMVGVVGCAGAFVLWFRAAPELMKQRGVSFEQLPELGQFVLGRPFQVFVLALTLVLIAGGYATRTTLGKERGTWVLAAGATVIVVALLMSLYGLGDLLGPDPATMVKP